MEPRLVGRRVRGLLGGTAAGLLTLAVLAAASTAGAADPAYTETEVEREIPVTIPAENPCTGEPVVIKGHLIFRVHLTINATHVTISEATYTQGVTAVNPITGVKHVTSDADTFTATIQKSTSAMGHQALLFTRSGETALVPDDFYLQYLIHFSWNAAGTVTTDITNFTADCR